MRPRSRRRRSSRSWRSGLARASGRPRRPRRRQPGDVRPAAVGGALARPDQRPPWQRAGAGAQPARAGPRAAALKAAGGRDVVILTVRLVGLDVGARDAASDPNDRTRAPPALGCGRARRAARAAGASSSSCRHATSRTRSWRRSCAFAPPRCTSASRPRSRRRIRRSLLGEAWERADNPGSSTSASSCITAAGAPTSITSAHTRPRSHRPISI